MNDFKNILTKLLFETTPEELTAQQQGQQTQQQGQQTQQANSGHRSMTTILSGIKTAIAGAIVEYESQVKSLVERASTKMRELSAAHGDLASTNDDLNTKVTQLGKDFKVQEKKVDKLLNALKKMVSSGRSQDTSQIEALSQEALQLKQDLGGKVSEIQELENQLGELRGTKSLAGDLIQNLEAHIADLNKDLDASEQTIAELHERALKFQKEVQQQLTRIPGMGEQTQSPSFGVNLRDHLERARKVDESKWGRKGPF
jgi:chromosome segregation ATPase